MTWDVDALRASFPALHQDANGHPLAWLDSAATTQKPLAVLDAMDRFLRQDNANVHRGVHALSQRATEQYEGARETVRRFLNARKASEIVFVRGATEGINLVANAWSRANLRPGDAVLLSGLEHHSDIVPWQILRDQVGTSIRVLPLDDRGDLRLDLLDDLLAPPTRLLAVTHVSNAIGTVNPVRDLVRAAHARGVKVLVDGAQAVSHLPVDVQDLECDFYVFSGHKVYGPPGIGVLYGRHEILDGMPPWQGGGDMILSVDFQRSVYHRAPYRFEAGTPNTVGAIGLGAALQWLGSLDRVALGAWETGLLAYAEERLRQVPGLSVVGAPRERCGALSFVLDGIHPHDIGTFLDQEGIAVRAGHHCAQPALRHFGLTATTRASFGPYNTPGEVDRLVDGLSRVVEVLR